MNHSLWFSILANGSCRANGILCREEQMGWHYKTASKGKAFHFLNFMIHKKIWITKSMQHKCSISHWKSESDQKPIYYNEDPAKIPPISGIIDQRREIREYVNQVCFIHYELSQNSFIFRKQLKNISLIVVSIIIQIQHHHHLYRNKRLYMKIQLIQSFNVLLMKRENCLISTIP